MLLTLYGPGILKSVLYTLTFVLLVSFCHSSRCGFSSGSRLLGRVAESLAGLFHLSFESLACFFPGFFAKRHLASPQTLARVLTRVFTAAPLPLASVVAFA